MQNQALPQQPQQGALPASGQMGGADTRRAPQPAAPVYTDWASI